MEIIKRVSNKTPKVSILCLCYNHEKWLEDCVSSLINQKTNFEYEIIIHDDASTDKSQELLRYYQEKYPEKITLILQSENQYSQKIKIFPNFLFAEGNGKYFAICECDDYFIDENKLQLQYDFMENHPDYSLTCHSAIRVDALTRSKVSEWTIGNADRDIDIKEMIKVGGILMPTNSMFFRSEIVKPGMPEFYHIAPIGDTPLMIFLGFNGKTHYINKLLSAYRINIPSSQTAVSNSKPLEKRREEINRAIEMYKSMDLYTNGSYHEYFEYACNRLDFGYYYLALDSKNLKREEFKVFRKQKKLFWLKFFLRKHLPSLYKKIAH